MGRVSVHRPVLKISSGRRVLRPDTLAAEEPLEIRLGGAALTVTMRT
ncbi:MAG TPA: sulfurtransferase FdhD, partial [Pseudonocardiaceae bacterium]|nr:sulfurtransferase FdhD [Pseudonocardiaceae bacterium]